MNSIKQRLFLVGCPRSGTTFLQGLITNNNSITTFPESHFYSYLLPSKPWLKKLNIASRWAKSRWQTFLGEMDRTDLISTIPKYNLFAPQLSHKFIATLDNLTLKEGHQIWLEKTPAHLFQINLIQKLVPQCKFIHILRNGEDVIASIYEMRTKYADSWGKNLITNQNYTSPQKTKTIDQQLIIEQSIDKWINSINTSKKYIDQPNHFFVYYDQLIENKTEYLRLIYDFIGLDLPSKTIDDRLPEDQKIILDTEPWKKQYDPHKKRNFTSIFSEKEQNYITSKIADTDLKCFLKY